MYLYMQSMLFSYQHHVSGILDHSCIHGSRGLATRHIRRMTLVCRSNCTSDAVAGNSRHALKSFCTHGGCPTWLQAVAAVRLLFSCLFLRSKGAMGVPQCVPQKITVILQTSSRGNFDCSKPESGLCQMLHSNLLCATRIAPCGCVLSC